MTASELFHEASRRGLRLKPAGVDKLAVVPARLCSPAFAEILREHKDELLSLICARDAKNLPEAVKVHRPLTEAERLLLVRWCGKDDDPLILYAVNLFNGRVTGIG